MESFAQETHFSHHIRNEGGEAGPGASGGQTEWRRLHFHSQRGGTEVLRGERWNSCAAEQALELAKNT